MEKYKNCYIRTVNLKYQPEHGTKNLNYLMDQNLYQIFKIILSIYYKNMGKRLLILP